MFKSIQDHNTKMMVIGAIKALRYDGYSDDAIIAAVMKTFDVTREYVLDAMKIEPEYDIHGALLKRESVISG